MQEVAFGRNGIMDEMTEGNQKISSISELSHFATEVLEKLSKSEAAKVITLKGDLGVGKTAFVKELAKALGVSEEITSPTFAIMKSYQTTHKDFSILTHIDAYRIEDVEEMKVLRFEEFLQDPNRIICIEWPERIETLLPKQTNSISLTINPDESRDITYAY